MALNCVETVWIKAVSGNVNQISIHIIIAFNCDSATKVDQKKFF